MNIFFTFYDFYLKNPFLTFLLFFGTFLFSSGEIFILLKPDKILLNLLHSCINRLLSDGFYMAAIKKYSHEEP